MKSLTLLPSNNITSEQTDIVLESKQQQGLLSPEMLVVIDPKVDDYQTLAKAVLPNATVLILDSKQDGIEQITEALLQHPVSSLHIVSHGSPGCLYLGNSELCLDTLDDYVSQLQTWSKITPDHQPLTLLLYGCNVAMGDGGEEFIQKLHQLTKAGIAASANRTGSNKLGGDWNLEIQRGNPIALTLVFSEDVQKDYNSVLATIVVNSTDDNTNDDGIVTLREAIEAANNDTTTELGDTGSEFDTIIFDPAVFDTPQTITLKNGPLKITDSLTLEGTGATNLTISGNNASRVLEISQVRSGTVSLRDITVANGYEGSLNGGGIRIYDSLLVYIIGCIVTGNTASGGSGGGISIEGQDFSNQVNMIDSTIYNNQAYLGGGISVNKGSFSVENSTISSNKSISDGGGIFADLDGVDEFGLNHQFSVLNSTIAFNIAETGDGGGIILSNGDIRRIDNSIIAGNLLQSTSGISPDISGSFVSDGFNLIGNPNGSTGLEKDKTVTDITQVLDVQLKNNGGSTLTHALVPNLVNPAIDAGNNQTLGSLLGLGSALDNDQRGAEFNRVVDGNGDGNAVVDLGAFELQEPIQQTLGSINGILYTDQNQNDIFDVGVDIPKPNITVFLDVNSNNEPDPEEPSTITNTNGFYQFSDLAQGNYLVQVVDTPDFTRITPVSAIAVAGVPVEVNIRGIVQQPSTGNISGIKFNDKNNNGSFEEGVDEPQSGVILFLDSNKNGILDPGLDSLPGEIETTTNSQGLYQFTNLQPGDYTIEEVVPPGFTRVTPVKPVAVVANETTTFNIANIQQIPATGNISGTKFIDVNNNGIFEPESEQSQSGVTLFLDGNNNDQLDQGEVQTQTSNQGYYSFSNLPPATYTVQEIVPTGFTRVTPVEPVAVVANETTTFNIANIAQTPETGNISGTKFIDSNNNGIFEPGTEQPQSGVTLFLDSNNNAIQDQGEFQTITNTQGVYSFLNLPPETYTVQEVVPPGFTRVTPVEPVAVIANETTTFNIANIQQISATGNISGTKFIDRNNNGNFEPGTDQPQSDVTLFLDLNNNNTFETEELQTITDSQGLYQFTNLPPGNYTIEEVVPTGFTRVTSVKPVAVVANETTTFNIANIQQTPATGNISGTKFIDRNNNGIFEPGTDQPQSGVTIFLDSNNNAIQDQGEFQTITNTQGVYSFLNLPPQTYTVQEIVLPGFTRVTPIIPVAVVANETTTFDIANIQQTPTTGNISGTKFNDLNANGILDIGEPGIAGIAIYLDLNNNSTLDTNEPGTLTDTTGFYQFNNLQPNIYILKEVQQPGFISTLVPNPVTIVPGLNAENINFGNGIPGILEFSNPIFSVNEDGTTNMDVMVTRTGGSVGTVDVTVLPTNGTANAGTDYDPTPITVSFINGDNTPKPIRIPIINDSRIEPDETINLFLVNPTNGAVLGVQSTAILTINRSDTGVPLNLGNVGDLQTVANNPLIRESGFDFSANALGIVSVEQGGSGNFIDPLSNPGQLANAITYDEGQSMIINVGDGFDQKFGFRYAAPFADHQVTIYDGVNGTGNVLASVQLPRTPDSNLTPGAYILENNPASTLFFEGIAKSVILGSQPNKLLINNITFG